MITLIAFSIFGCTENTLHSLNEATGPGELALRGRVCSADGSQWLSGAQVYTHLFSSEGQHLDTLETRTDPDGYYAFDGLDENVTYTIYVQDGHDVIDQYDVTMPEVDVVLPDPPCLGEGKIAVITGDYDDFSTVLLDLGVNWFDVVEGAYAQELVQFLANPDAMGAYQAVFFPGGHVEEDIFYDRDDSDTADHVGQSLDGIRSYVEAGGTIVVSDWSYDGVEAIWPDAIDFFGDDTLPDAAQVGEPATVPSTLHGDVESYVNANSIPVHFDLDTWPVIEDVGGGTEVLMRGAAPYRFGTETDTVSNSPLMVRFEAGEGQVILTTWRADANVDEDGELVLRWILEQF